jgi:isopentenyl-diphosphate delta-isomerase type 1
MAESDLILIVDNNDKPIGNETMKKARAEGLIHRIVRVMVEDSKGRVLLQKRTNKVLWPHAWDNSAAGHVDADEEYLPAAKRELFEEIGIKTDELQDMGTYFTDTVQDGRILKRFNRVYRLIKDDAPTDVHNEEVAEVKWFTVEEAKKLIKEHPDKVTDGLSDVITRYY